MGGNLFSFRCSVFFVDERRKNILQKLKRVHLKCNNSSLSRSRTLIDIKFQNFMHLNLLFLRVLVTLFFSLFFFDECTSCHRFICFFDFWFEWNRFRGRSAFENNKILVKQPIKQRWRRFLSPRRAFFLESRASGITQRSDCFLLPFAVASAYAILVNHHRYNKVK